MELKFSNKALKKAVWIRKWCSALGRTLINTTTTTTATTKYNFEYLRSDWVEIFFKTSVTKFFLTVSNKHFHTSNLNNQPFLIFSPSTNGYAINKYSSEIRYFF